MSQHIQKKCIASPKSVQQARKDAKKTKGGEKPTITEGKPECIFFKRLEIPFKYVASPNVGLPAGRDAEKTKGGEKPTITKGKPQYCRGIFFL